MNTELEYLEGQIKMSEEQERYEDALAERGLFARVHELVEEFREDSVQEIYDKVLAVMRPNVAKIVEELFGGARPDWLDPDDIINREVDVALDDL